MTMLLASATGDEGMRVALGVIQSLFADLNDELMYSPVKDALISPDVKHQPPTPTDYEEAKATIRRDMLYKTSRCLSWDQYRGCKCGDKCRFVHPGEKYRMRPPEYVIEAYTNNEAWRLADARQADEPECMPCMKA